jgi:putative serine protease PepD
MSEQQGESEPSAAGPAHPPPGPTRTWFSSHAGWLLGGAAALVAIGLSIAALVVAVNNRSMSANGTSAAADVPACAAAEVARQQLPSVVTIQVAGETTGGTGSGEVIDAQGHILTNNHVVSPAVSGGAVTVLFSDGRTEPATIVGRDPQTDVAVLKVANASGLRPITFGSSANLQVGQPVIALGAPLGLAGTVTAGIVSALDRSVNVPSDNGSTAILVAAIQTDAAINPGNSGGALVNCAGELVGVPSAGATVPTAEGGSSAGNIGIGFAIPSDFAKTIAGEIIANGTVSHGFFGLTVVTVGGRQPGSQPAGLYVTSVTPGGPAQAAGIRVGDLITEIAGAPATSAQQLLLATLRNRPGDVVQLTYEREGTKQQADVTLGSR